MAIFGKIGAGLARIGQYYTSPEGAQSAMAILQDYGTGDSANYRGLQAQRRKDTEAQKQQQALTALMSRMQGPDTRSPVINQMIDATNQRAMGYSNGPTQQMGHVDVAKAGLPMDQETMSLLAKYGSAGGNMELPLAFSKMMQPDKMEIQNAGDGYIIGIDPATGQAKPIYQRPVDPLDSAMKQAQINYYNSGVPLRQAQAKQATAKALQPYAPHVAAKKPWEMF
jgi:hypothetical protein